MKHPKHYFRCKYLDWHKPDATMHSEGINSVARCKYCGRAIMQDSQGNWFTYLKDDYDSVREEYR